jgi:hypothetical protein
MARNRCSRGNRSAKLIAQQHAFLLTPNITHFKHIVVVLYIHSPRTAKSQLHTTQPCIVMHNFSNK